MLLWDPSNSVTPPSPSPLLAQWVSARQEEQRGRKKSKADTMIAGESAMWCGLCVHYLVVDRAHRCLAATTAKAGQVSLLQRGEASVRAGPGWRFDAGRHRKQIDETTFQIANSLLPHQLNYTYHTSKIQRITNNLN